MKPRYRILWSFGDWSILKKGDIESHFVEQDGYLKNSNQKDFIILVAMTAFLGLVD